MTWSLYMQLSLPVPRQNPVPFVNHQCKMHRYLTCMYNRDSWTNFTNKDFCMVYAWITITYPMYKGALWRSHDFLSLKFYPSFCSIVHTRTMLNLSSNSPELGRGTLEAMPSFGFGGVAPGGGCAFESRAWNSSRVPAAFPIIQAAPRFHAPKSRLNSLTQDKWKTRRSSEKNGKLSNQSNESAKFDGNTPNFRLSLVDLNITRYPKSYGAHAERCGDRAFTGTKKTQLSSSRRDFSYGAFSFLPSVQASPWTTFATVPGSLLIRLQQKRVSKLINVSCKLAERYKPQIQGGS